MPGRNLGLRIGNLQSGIGITAIGDFANDFRLDAIDDVVLSARLNSSEAGHSNRVRGVKDTRCATDSDINGKFVDSHQGSDGTVLASDEVLGTNRRRHFVEVGVIERKCIEYWKIVMKTKGVCTRLFPANKEENLGSQDDNHSDDESRRHLQF